MSERERAGRVGGRSERLRLFVAADVPPELLDSVNRALAPLRSRDDLGSARWTKPANQHLTLKFLGWVDAEARDPIDEAVGGVAGAHEAGVVTLEGLGAFPSQRRARVLWLGLRDPRALLTALATALDSSLEPLGFEAEKRAFTPHLTLARFKPPASIQGVLNEVELPEASFDVGHLALYRSRLHPKGASYEVLEAFPLGGRR
ncbi:MAG: RNA 2',3'-cyclic phosphodiesterase [Actinomycetota bacterium]